MLWHRARFVAEDEKGNLIVLPMIKKPIRASGSTARPPRRFGSGDVLYLCLAALLSGCVSYPTMLDKKLTNTETKYRQDGTIESVTVSEHTPDTLAQQSISNASPSGQVIEGCTFNLADLEETAQVAFGAARTPNPCLVASSNSNYFDAEIVDAQAQAAIADDLIGATVIGMAINTAGSVVKAGFDNAGGNFTTGDNTQTTYIDGAELAAAQGGEGGFGGAGSGDGDGTGGFGGEGGAGAGATGAPSTSGNNSLIIGPGNASSIAGTEALSASGTKSGRDIEDGDGVINRGTDESDNNVNAAIDLQFPAIAP